MGRHTGWKYFALAASMLLAACVSPRPVGSAAPASSCSQGFETGSFVKRQQCLTPEQIQEQQRKAQALQDSLRSMPGEPKNLN